MLLVVRDKDIQYVNKYISDISDIGGDRYDIDNRKSIEGKISKKQKKNRQYFGNISKKN